MGNVAIYEKRLWGKKEVMSRNEYRLHSHLIINESKDFDEVAKLSPLAYGWGLGDSFPTTTYVW